MCTRPKKRRGANALTEKTEEYLDLSIKVCHAQLSLMKKMESFIDSQMSHPTHRTTPMETASLLGGTSNVLIEGMQLPLNIDFNEDLC